ncbi:MAG: tripartite tricarboxylate transporter TctB family protein [Deltaproteobacteria bacterium]|nr:tripartite tricarboxylate transporter TctB family protein [Deltaproteobacteria bacterium]
MTKNVNSDLIAGIFGLLLSAVFWFSIDEEIGRLSVMFPRAMVIVMALISVVIFVKGFVKAERSDVFAVGDPRRVLVTGALFFAWYLAMTILGFFVASVLAITSIVYYLSISTRRLTLKVFTGWVLIVVVEVFFFYFIFSSLLHVPLPEGLFF